MKTPSEIAVEKYLSAENLEVIKRLADKKERIEKNFPNAKVDGENLHYDSIVLVPVFDFHHSYGFDIYNPEGYYNAILNEVELGKFLINKSGIDKRRAYDKKIWGRIKFLFFSFLFIVISGFGYCLIFLKK